MAKLNATMRKKIPGRKFGIPSRRAYPMPDKAHAQNAKAKARARQMLKAGKLSASAYAHIMAMANRILGK